MLVMSTSPEDVDLRLRVVSIVTGYGLVDQAVKFEYWKGQEFSLLHIVQTGSGAHPASYPMGSGGSFPGVKWQGLKLIIHIKLRLRSTNNNSVALVREQTILTERPPLVGEVSVNFCG
jgi:hypothetical protein